MLSHVNYGTLTTAYLWFTVRSHSKCTRHSGQIVEHCEPRQ